MNNLVVLINSFGILYISYLAKNYIDKKEKEQEFIFQEISLLKSLHLMNREALRNIVRKLPFKGEEWMSEFILRDIQDQLNIVEEVKEEPEELDEKNGLSEEDKKVMREKLDAFQVEFEKSLCNVARELDKQNF